MRLFEVDEPPAGARRRRTKPQAWAVCPRCRHLIEPGTIVIQAKDSAGEWESSHLHCPPRRPATST